MPTATWDGITRTATLRVEAAAQRHEIADRAKSADWTALLQLLSGHPEWINAARPDGISWYAPLHQAAYNGAPVAVVQQLLARGAWRTLRTAHGERPVDIARRQGHAHLLLILVPVLTRDVPAAALHQLQRHFHDLIRTRAGALVEEHALRLPELEPLLELDDPRVWFAIPGMYGGFSYCLAGDEANAKLITESWSRVAGGSGQRHEITPEGSQLVAEGIV